MKKYEIEHVKTQKENDILSVVGSAVKLLMSILLIVFFILGSIPAFYQSSGQIADALKEVQDTGFVGPPNYLMMLYEFEIIVMVILYVKTKRLLFLLALPLLLFATYLILSSIL